MRIVYIFPNKSNLFIGAKYSWKNYKRLIQIKKDNEKYE